MDDYTMEDSQVISSMGKENMSLEMERYFMDSLLVERNTEPEK